jgi:hypothetical protein
MQADQRTYATAALTRLLRHDCAGPTSPSNCVILPVLAPASARAPPSIEASTRTARLVADDLRLGVVHIEQEEREICAGAVLAGLEQLACGLEKDVDRSVHLARLLVARGERARLLVRLVGLAGLDERQDRLERLCRRWGGARHGGQTWKSRVSAPF